MTQAWHVIGSTLLLAACPPGNPVSYVDLAMVDDLSVPADAAEVPDLSSNADFTQPQPDLTVADLVVRDFASTDLAVTYAPVSHSRELRAAWVATVSRLDFPSRVNLTPLEARTEITAIVDAAANAGLNALFFQIRPESDAFYVSALEPWSRYVSGTQGLDPGYDPLALFIEIGHNRGVEIHAWMNPYRAVASAGSPTAPTHVTNLYPAEAITYGSLVMMNPASTVVRQHVIDVVTDVTARYDIDGVVFDDYFYPYPNGSPFPDDASYQAYVTGGGMLSKSDWRRDNVNRLIQAVSGAINTTKPWVRWGVAPFGIYRPNQPPGVTGLDAYETLSCDSLHWMNQSWVDYLSPQLYWTSTSSGQPFGALIDWWASNSRPGRPIIASLALYKIGTAPEWSGSEIETQVALTRGEATASQGQVWFRMATIRNNQGGALTNFGNFYGVPARPPVVPAMASTSLAPPLVGAAGTSITLSHATPAALRGYAVYREVAATMTFYRWVPSMTVTTTTLGPGRYAISALARGDVESTGVVLEIP